MKTRIAKYISILGHPLLTISIYVVLTLFIYEDSAKALWISLLIIGGIFIPLTVKMYRKSKNGTYTNFDVSEQSQRQSWYLVATALLFLICVVLFVTDQSRILRMSVLSVLLLMITSQLINYYIKSSLHISLNVFLGFLILTTNSAFGVFFFVFIIFIGWSRIVLNRHTLKEILTGAIIGFIFGLIFLLTYKNEMGNLNT